MDVDAEPAVCRPRSSDPGDLLQANGLELRGSLVGRGPSLGLDGQEDSRCISVKFRKLTNTCSTVSLVSAV